MQAIPGPGVEPVEAAVGDMERCGHVIVLDQRLNDFHTMGGIGSIVAYACFGPSKDGLNTVFSDSLRIGF